MIAGALLDVTRMAWLTLAIMMLLSRVVFQFAGPVWMRSFLDGWQSGRVKRVWGTCALAFAAYLLVAALTQAGELSTFDEVLLIGLLLVLFADGLVNVLPAGFETFKTKMQDAWVARHRGSGT